MNARVYNSPRGGWTAAVSYTDLTGEFRQIQRPARNKATAEAKLARIVARVEAELNPDTGDRFPEIVARFDSWRGSSRDPSYCTAKGPCSLCQEWKDMDWLINEVERLRKEAR